MTTKITQPVANGKTKISSFLETASADATFIVVSVIADQPLILNVQQAYDEDFFDSIGTEEYTDVGAESTFRFPRIGVKNFFTLSNTSGTDCTFTRAFAEFRNQTSSNIVSIDDVIDTNDDLSHTKLDTLNQNIQALNQSIIGLQKQSPVYYREEGDAYYVTSPEFNTSTTPVDELVIYNPAGSGKTIYLYQVSFFGNVVGASGATYNATVIAEKISNYDGGINIISSFKGNSNLSLQNDSVLEAVTKPSSVAGEGRIFRKNINHSADSNIINYQHEFLEIPPGLGVNFRVNASSTDVSMNFNLRYVEELSDAPPQLELRSIIPDVDPQGDPIRTDEAGLTEYTWEFTTTGATEYGLFSLTNNKVVADEERITTLYVSSDSGQTNVLDPSIFESVVGGISLGQDGAEYNLLFADDIVDGEVPQAVLTLLPNTAYEFKVRTLFNDNDEGGPNDADIRLGIVPSNAAEALEFAYLNVAIASS